ncbi:MAG: HDOD domain-containing protein [Campylobacterota bacterium]|nr:HDOD domain-containing protein [Campylobacterota bacterium]
MSYIPMIARVSSLPPLPESVIKLEGLYAQGDPDIDQIVKIIESDPSLTADLLSKVNAPLYSFSRQIISVLQAVTLFGSAKIRAMVLSSMVERSFDVDLEPYGISTEEFAKISMMQSELMFQWYMGVDIDVAKLLTPIAFLMETGKILIAKDILDRHKEDEFLRDVQNFDKLRYVENIHVNMTTAQINALIFEHWKLNSTFIECMKYQGNEHEVPDSIKREVDALNIVRAAVNIKEQFSEDSIEDASKKLAEASYDLDKFMSVIKRIKEKYL